MISLAKLIKHQQPFSWYEFTEVFANDVRRELIKTFPQEDFFICENNSGEKPYKMFLKQAYYSGRKDVIFEFPRNWQNFLQTLLSKEYIQLLENTLKVNLRGCKIELNLWKYHTGCYLAPHLDKDNKFLTQLFYFNNDWDKNWGGALRLLNSSQINDFAHEIFPDSDSSIVFQQSNLSWHAVTEQKNNPNQSRNVVQLIFWKENTCD